MSKRILVVEDDQEHRQILCEIAEGIGYQAAGASRATEAWEALQEQPADLIVLDLKMPQVQGHQFLHYLRQKGNKTPVIVVSGYMQRDILETLAAAEGVVAILAKPFTIRRVAKEVSQALEGAPPPAG
jgi:CheY-like chemotaxis protein